MVGAMSRAAGRPSTVPAPAGTGSRITLAGLAAWSILPPYLGPLLGLELDVPAGVEAVDHLVPGALALAAAAWTVGLARRGETQSTRVSGAFAVCALAGFFQAVTHISLVFDIGDVGRPADAVLLHATAGPALLALAAWHLARSEGDA